MTLYCKPSLCTEQHPYAGALLFERNYSCDDLGDAHSAMAGATTVSDPTTWPNMFGNLGNRLQSLN